MALVSVLGTSAVVGIGAAGATLITDWIDSVDLGDSYNANDITTLGHTQVVEDPGLRAFDIGFSGFWDATINTTLAAEQGVRGHHLIVSPAGTGTGTPKLDYTGWLGDFNKSIGSPGDPITFDCTFHVTAYSEGTNS